MNKREIRSAIGNHLDDPFMDSFQEEVLCCCDIIDIIDKCDAPCVRIIFDKDFLKKIVKSHIYHIRNMERAISGTTYAN